MVANLLAFMEFTLNSKEKTKIMNKNTNIHMYRRLAEVGVSYISSVVVGSPFIVYVRLLFIILFDYFNAPYSTQPTFIYTYMNFWEWNVCVCARLPVSRHSESVSLYVHGFVYNEIHSLHLLCKQLSKFIGQRRKMWL